MMQTKRIIYLFLIFAAVSCSKQPVRSEITPTTEPTLTSTIAPTATLQKTPTLIAPTATFQKTPTLLEQTPTATPTTEKAPTFLPTLPISLAQEQALEFIKTNGNCDLPCWWGLEPGKTTYEEVNRLLSPLTVREPSFMGDITQIGWVGYSVPVPQSLSVLEEVYIEMKFARSMLRYTHIYLLQRDAYSMPSLLRKYGPPEQILLSTQDTPLGIPPPFTLYLFYPQKGILAYYASDSEKNEIEYSTNIIHGCFSKPASPFLYLWSPDEQLTLDQVVENMSVPGFDEPGFVELPIDQATGMDIQHFYQTYKDVKTSPCVQTPKKLWPKP